MLLLFPPGPRNVRVVGVLDEADVERTRTDVEGGGLLQGVQIVVGLPKHLAQVPVSSSIRPRLDRILSVICRHLVRDLALNFLRRGFWQLRVNTSLGFG